MGRGGAVGGEGPSVVGMGVGRGHEGAKGRGEDVGRLGLGSNFSTAIP